MKTFFLAFVALDAASTWKGRSASLPPGMDLETMSKQMCNMYMYMILSNENPTEYPAMAGPGESSGDISYSSSGGSCTIEEGHGAIIIENCDCSDPKKYDFADQALCKSIPADDKSDTNDKGLEKLIDLTCTEEDLTDTSLFNFLSVGLMILQQLHDSATTTTTVKVSEEESGFLINSVSISLLAAMTIFN